MTELGIAGSPDDVNRVTELFKVMLKHYVNGVVPEVRTPVLPEPVEPTDDSTEAKNQYKKLLVDYNEKKLIDTHNRKSYLLQHGGDLDPADIKYLEDPSGFGSESDEQATAPDEESKSK